nr:hypothetical protein [Mucilaginibacter sp. L294]
MKVDNPQAFRFIMQDEIYLLDKDKGGNTHPLVTAPVVTEKQESATVAAEVTEQSAQIAPPVKEQFVNPPEAVAVIPPTPGPVIQTVEAEFNYLGKNNKNFLVLVNYATEKHIAEAHLAALQNILKRKELNLDDVAILNVNTYAPVKLTALAAYFAPTRLVVMGKDALPEGIGNLPLNQPLQGKKTHVLYSFSFDEMMSSNDNKKTFWEHMKTL